MEVGPGGLTDDWRGSIDASEHLRAHVRLRARARACVREEAAQVAA